MAICAFLFLEKKNPSQYFQFSNVLTVRIRRMFDETWTLRTRGLINYSKKLNLLRIACLRVRSFVHTHRKRERERERERTCTAGLVLVWRGQKQLHRQRTKGERVKEQCLCCPRFPSHAPDTAELIISSWQRAKRVAIETDRERERERERGRREMDKRGSTLVTEAEETDGRN